jgi:hypothetical protein
VSGPPRQDSREWQLRCAIHRAKGLSTSDRWVYDTLLWMSNWSTSVLPAEFQPKGIAGLSATTESVSVRQTNYSLNHLELHGWVVRDRKPLGRGYRTFYAVEMGKDCDCKVRTECTLSRDEVRSDCTEKCAEPAPESAGESAHLSDRAVTGEERLGRWNELTKHLFDD